MKKGSEPSMPHDAYPLRTVASQTGLTPDIIRAWEKRYSVVAPVRGARGARLYSAADIAHLRLLARVVGAGRAIGDVAGLHRADLEQLAAQTGRQIAAPREDFVGRVLERLERFDQAAVARLLGDALIGLGGRDFIHQVAVPLLREVGERWHQGTLSIADEHLLSGMLRNLMAGLIQSRGGPGFPRLLLATPTGEQHDLGLLIIALLALDVGLEVSYLGADVPAADIVAAAKRSGATIVGIALVYGDNSTHAVHEVSEILRGLPTAVELWLGGPEAASVAARVKSFRGSVLDALPKVELEFARVRTAPQYGREWRIHDRQAPSES
jgi:DNA-binding transcriptional MerR regulator